MLEVRFKWLKSFLIENQLKVWVSRVEPEFKIEKARVLGSAVFMWRSALGPNLSHFNVNWITFAPLWSHLKVLSG